jgi:membrane protein
LTINISVRRFMLALVREANTAQVFLLAEAIAFKVLITLVPVFILVTGVLGRILRNESSFAGVLDLVRDFLPAYQQDPIIDLLVRVQQASGAFTLIGVVGLLFTAVTLFGTLRRAIHTVFDGWAGTGRTLALAYVFDLRMVLQVGLFFLLSIGISLAIQTLNAAGIGFIARLGLDTVWVQDGWRRFFKLLGLFLPLLLSTAMFWQLLYFIPFSRPGRRSALLGAFITALLWELAKYGFTFYATHVGTFDRYRGGAGTDGFAALGDTFGLIITLVVWTYYSGLVFMVGALITKLHHTRGHRTPEPIEAQTIPDAPG